MCVYVCVCEVNHYRVYLTGNASVSVDVSESGHINMSGLTCHWAQFVKIDMIPLSLLSSSQMSSKSSNVTRSQVFLMRNEAASNSHVLPAFSWRMVLIVWPRFLLMSKTY